LAAAAVLILWSSPAWGDRVAVIALGSPEPVLQADRAAATLAAKGHRVLGPADTAARLSSGDADVGADWAARTREAIDAARTALTRLDRRSAVSAERGIVSEIVSRGGGAGGADVLVDWCLLERQILATAGDAAGAAAWLDRAAAVSAAVELDPLRHPEQERDVFARRRAALLAEVPASLSVASAPPADVWIDGVRRCATPCTTKLAPGRHLALVVSPAHSPGAIDVELAPGSEQRRSLALAAAYTGASPQAIAQMLSDPARRAEGASALEPMARFLDVDRIVAILPEDPLYRVFVGPPATGRSRAGPAVADRELAEAVFEQLRPAADAEAPASTSLLSKPGFWIAGVAVVAAVVGGALIYNASRPPQTGTLVITSP
jgi:hypothetical protein